MKIIAFYLPQFHCIPENDKNWGKGFTEWTNVKKASPLFANHYQPRIPYKERYYNLLDNNETLRWQDGLAQEYSVYGFCFYHYWFNGKKLLQKPVENYHNDTSLKTRYCICWANEHWTTQWTSSKSKVLIEQTYGEKENWKEHFEYLLPFFQDGRYIKDENRPLLVIYRPELIPCLNEMLDYWESLARKYGFDGMSYAYQHVSFDMIPNRDDSRFKYNIEYQPNYAQTLIIQNKWTTLRKIKRSITRFLEKKMSIDVRTIHETKLTLFDYDTIWSYILKMNPVSNKSIPGAFVDWDNTPRKGKRGIVYTGVTPEKFEKYLTKQIIHAEKDYKSQFLFLFAWNEWSEGGYIEPDQKNGFAMLEAIKRAQLAAANIMKEQK